MTNPEPERPDLTAEWGRLGRAERIRLISTALGIDPESSATVHLSTVPPSGWTESLRPREAARAYGFPSEPSAGDTWTAWDGSVWTFSDLVPWWNLTRRSDDVRPET